MTKNKEGKKEYIIYDCIINFATIDSIKITKEKNHIKDAKCYS